MQQRHRIQHADSVARGDLGMLAHVRADRDEHGIEPAGVAFGDHVGDLVVQHDPHAHLVQCGRSRPSDRRVAGGRQECRNAACRRAAGRPRGFRPDDRAGSDDTRLTGRSVLRRPPEHACPWPARPARSSPRQSPHRRENARPHGSTRRSPAQRDCMRFRTGGSRPCHASPATDCRPSAFPMPAGSHPPAPGPASPGCSRRLDTRGCMAATARHSPARGYGMVPGRGAASDRRPGSDRGPSATSPVLVHRPFWLRSPGRPDWPHREKRVGHEITGASGHVVISKALTWINQVFGGNLYPGAPCHPV